MFSVYVTPILKSGGKRFAGKDLAKFLIGRLKYSLARAGKKHIEQASKKAFRNGKGARIRKSLNYTIGKMSVTFHISKIGFFHNSGVSKHKMKYLTKAKRPIPIRTKDGELIFRWASKKSMKNKKSWTHPGLAPKGFIEKGIEKMKQEMRVRLREDSSKYLRGKK